MIAQKHFNFIFSSFLSFSIQPNTFISLSYNMNFFTLCKHIYGAHSYYILYCPCTTSCLLETTKGNPSVLSNKKLPATLGKLPSKKPNIEIDRSKLKLLGFVKYVILYINKELGAIIIECIYKQNPEFDLYMSWNWSSLSCTIECICNLFHQNVLDFHLITIKSA